MEFDKPNRYKSFHWIREGQDTKVVSIRVPAETAEWLAEQTRYEGINVTWLVNRAINFERGRVNALGYNPSKDDLDYGLV